MITLIRAAVDPRLLFWPLSLSISLIVGGDLFAATSVLSNQTLDVVSVELPSRGASPYRVTLRPAESVPLVITGPVLCEYASDDRRLQTVIQPNSVYYFAINEQRRLELRSLGLHATEEEDAEKADGVVDKADGVVDMDETGKPGVIRVKLLMDDDEVRKQAVWEQRLRKRVDAASKILEFFCRMRLEVVSVGRWNTSDEIHDFDKTLKEFESVVDAAPAQLVIGFTSQYTLQRRQARLGGTRGPLHSHILIREHGPRIGEVERLEVLLHELGHHFGAAHSPEVESLMRPILGDGQANRRSFRLAFDPVNMLAMNLISEQLREKGAIRFGQLPVPVRRRLLGIYDLLNEAQADDPVAKQLAAAVRSGLPDEPADRDRSRGPGRQIEDISTVAAAEFTRAVRSVIDAIGHEAGSNQPPPLPGAAVRPPPSSDELTTTYIRVAAAAAANAPPELSIRAFYVGLGIALDREHLISRYLPVAERIRISESDEQRERRLALVGEPTIHGRADLLQQFIAIGIMTTISGPKAAEAAGMLKEIRDANGEAGFSFADVTVNISGIRFSQSLISGQLTLDNVARRFTVDDFVPKVDSVPDVLTGDQFRARYGTIYSDRCRQELDRIRERTADLSGYPRS